MLKDLIKEQEKFSPFLRGRDYTFIGPSDPNLFDQFCRIVNDYAPVTGFNRSIHDALSHEKSVSVALQHFPQNIELKIYVISRVDDSMLLFSDIHLYCQRNNLSYEN